MAGFRVVHSHGLTETVDTYEQAEELVRAVYGADAAIGHDGDISEGGESTLCWRTADDAENDDGVRSVAKIWRQQ